MVAGDPRRGQRGDTQRSRQKLVSDLRRRQRIRPQRCPPLPPGVLHDYDPAAVTVDGSDVTTIVDTVSGYDIPFFSGEHAEQSTSNGHPVVTFSDFGGYQHISPAYPVVESSARTVVWVAAVQLQSNSRVELLSYHDDFRGDSDLVVEMWSLIAEDSSSTHTWVGNNQTFLSPFPGSVSAGEPLLAVSITDATTEGHVDGVDCDQQSEQSPGVDFPAVLKWGGGGNGNESFAQFDFNGENATVYRCVVWDRRLSDAELDEVRAWAACNYGTPDC